MKSSSRTIWVKITFPVNQNNNNNNNNNNNSIITIIIIKMKKILIAGPTIGSSHFTNHFVSLTGEE